MPLERVRRVRFAPGKHALIAKLPRQNGARTNSNLFAQFLGNGGCSFAGYPRLGFHRYECDLLRYYCQQAPPEIKDEFGFCATDNVAPPELGVAADDGLAIQRFHLLPLQLQADNRSAPPTHLFARLRETFHIRMPRQNCLYTSPHIPDSFPVDNPDFVNPFGPAFLDIIGNQLTEVLRPKTVQIELAGDRQRHRPLRKSFLTVTVHP